MPALGHSRIRFSIWGELKQQARANRYESAGAAGSESAAARALVTKERGLRETRVQKLRMVRAFESGAVDSPKQ